MRIPTRNVFIGLVVAGLVGIVLLITLRGGCSGEQMRPKYSPGAEDLRGSVHSVAPVRRSSITATPPQTSTSDPIIDSWMQCVDQSDYDKFKDCVFANEPTQYDPADVARVLRSLGVRDVRANFILRESILKVNPGELPAFIDELFIAFGSDDDLQIPIEATMVGIANDYPDWDEHVLLGLAPEWLFGSVSTQGPIMAITMLGVRSREVQRLLQEGARGEWGGQPHVISRALSSAVWLLSDDPEGASAFLLSVYDSPTRPRSPDFGGLLAALLVLPQNTPPQNATLHCQCLLEILQDPDYREQAARQIYSMFGLQVPGNLSEAHWEKIREEMKFVLRL